MKLIKPSFEIWNSTNNIEKDIERVARVCYKSENKITSNSASLFVNGLIKRKHFAMLEHGTIYLMVTISNPEYDKIVLRYTINPYSRVLKFKNAAYITTNYRVIIENHWESDLDFVTASKLAHDKRHTVHFICDIGVGREFTRHRVMSMAQESTRYCNYSRDKFGNELTFIIPNWTLIKEGNYNKKEYYDSTYYTDYSRDFEFITACFNAEDSYLALINEGKCTAQEARVVLPLTTKSELVLTGFVDQWQHFFDLRARGTTGAPHPQAKELAIPLMNEFIKRGIIQ